MSKSNTAPKESPKRLRQSASFWPLRNPMVGGLLLVMLTLAFVLDNPSGESEPLRALGALAGIGISGIAGLAGRLIGRGIAAAGIRTAVGGTAGQAIRPAITSLAPRGSGFLIRRGGLLVAGGAAFEGGSRLLPGGGGGGAPGGFAGPLGGNIGPGLAVEGFEPGARFGDTFITRIWQSGTTRDGVPIIHGLLANGKRFATNRFGGVKQFRVKKPIVFSSDPRLSDARKVARIANKMETAAEAILKISGKKAVKR